MSPDTACQTHQTVSTTGITDSQRVVSLHSAVALARRPQLLLNLAPSEPVPTARGAERRLQHALPHPCADGAGGDAHPTRHLAAADQRFVARFGHGSDGRSTFHAIKAVSTIDAIKA